MNRITTMVSKVQDLLDRTSEERRAAVESRLALQFDEHFVMQQNQAEACASGLLTTEEALIVYGALGKTFSRDDNGGWAAGTGLATKVVVTQLMSELLAAKLGRAAR
jgi:hypothetical protein